MKNSPQIRTLYKLVNNEQLLQKRYGKKKVIIGNLGERITE